MTIVQMRHGRKIVERVDERGRIVGADAQRMDRNDWEVLRTQRRPLVSKTAQGLPPAARLDWNEHIQKGRSYMWAGRLTRWHQQDAVQNAAKGIDWGSARLSDLDRKVARPKAAQLGRQVMDALTGDRF